MTQRREANFFMEEEFFDSFPRWGFYDQNDEGPSPRKKKYSKKKIPSIFGIPQKSLFNIYSNKECAHFNIPKCLSPYLTPPIISASFESMNFHPFCVQCFLFVFNLRIQSVDFALKLFDCVLLGGNVQVVGLIRGFGMGLGMGDE